MNAELAKIRELMGNDERFDYKPRPLKEDQRSVMAKDLNIIMYELYSSMANGSVDISTFAIKFARCIYFILMAFNEMGIYPDYFYNQIVEIWIQYRLKMDHANRLLKNYQEIKKSGLPLVQSSKIKAGIVNKKYLFNPDDVSNISKVYYDMIDSYDAFDISHYTPQSITKEQIAKAFSDIRFNCMNIMTNPLNGDGVINMIDDIELLSSLLFEYISFFAFLGIDPTDYLDLHIQSLGLQAGDQK